MIIIKSLLFIPWNILLGYCLLLSIRWILFNDKSRFIFGKHIPLTPGIIVSKRDWLFNKARDIIHDYLDQAENAYKQNGYLTKWEKMIYQKVWDWTIFIDQWKFVPKNLKTRIREMISKTAKDTASRILRKTVPRMAERLRVEFYIDKYDLQFSVDFFYQYFSKYVYTPLFYILLGLNLVIGIMNTLLFILISINW